MSLKEVESTALLLFFAFIDWLNGKIERKGRVKRTMCGKGAYVTHKEARDSARKDIEKWRLMK